MSNVKLANTDAYGIGQEKQLKAAAEIIWKISPDILIINEIDHDINAFQAGHDLALNARQFNDAYLNQGDKPLTYQFAYAAPCNTGFLAGKDFDNNGMVATVKDQGSREHGGDCYGYGVYPQVSIQWRFCRVSLSSMRMLELFKSFFGRIFLITLFPTNGTLKMK